MLSCNDSASNDDDNNSALPIYSYQGSYYEPLELELDDTDFIGTVGPYAAGFDNKNDDKLAELAKAPTGSYYSVSIDSGSEYVIQLTNLSGDYDVFIFGYTNNNDLYFLTESNNESLANEVVTLLSDSTNDIVRLLLFVNNYSSKDTIGGEFNITVYSYATFFQK